MMRLRTLDKVLCTAALAVLLTACGSTEEDPSVLEPAEPQPTSTEDAAPTTEDAAPTTEDEQPTTEAPADGLPSEPTAYAQTFVAAVQEGDEDLALRLGPVDGFAGVEAWAELTAGQPELSEDPEGTLVVVPFEEGGQLQVWLDLDLVEGQQDHGVEAVVYEESTSG
ncbi:hypothetical protein FB467_1066 [Ornithinicoccus hortensis]|uniref:Lipoprotein n=2 Tax=Ornithinicoccus hortensis TaxID=82346 RepID=A0A542YPD5_9MICO|nr:hypothetical protein FB467_1066 [Ornithinicoccus hortensis]